MPKGSDKDLKTRKKAIQDATRYATEIPLEVMKTALDSMEVMEAMLKQGLPSSLSDAGVGMLCARTAVAGAYFNVRINARDLDDRDFAEGILSEAKKIHLEAQDREANAIELIDSRM